MSNRSMHMSQSINTRILFLFLMVSVFSVATRAQENPKDEFVKLTYQQEDLAVDLGVGLWAWPLPMDFDQDGDLDLVVACPDVPSNGLHLFDHLDEGDGAKFAASSWLAPASKNLQVSYVDGEPRVLGPGVEYINFRSDLLSNPKTIFAHEELESNHDKNRFSQWKYVDYEGDGDQDLLVGIDDWAEYGWDNAFDDKGHWTNGPLHGYVYLLINDEDEYTLEGKMQAAGKDIDVYGAPSPNMADFDGDGDLDLICGEFLDRLSWFENVGSRAEPLFSAGRFLENDNGLVKMDLEMIIPVAVDWDGDSDIDLIIGDEDGRVAFLENTGEVWDGMPFFKSPHYIKQQAHEVKFGALVTPYSVDWDQDGDEDLICGNTAGYIGFLENMNGGNPPQWSDIKYLEIGDEPLRIMAGENGSIQGPAEAKWGYTTLSVADWDHDGLLDVVVNSIWGRVQWYRNAGKIGDLKVLAAQDVQVDWSSYDTIPYPAWNWWKPTGSELATQWRTTPQAIDWNRDGLTDLVMLDHEGYLAFFERFRKDGALMLRPGERIFYGTKGSQFGRGNKIEDESLGPLRLSNRNAGGSGRIKWCFHDWDGDGDLDLLVNSKNIAWFEQEGIEDGRVLMKYRGDISEVKLAGHTTSPTIVGWDKDGRGELLVGAEDGYLYLWKGK